MEFNRDAVTRGTCTDTPGRTLYSFSAQRRHGVHLKRNLIKYLVLIVITGVFIVLASEAVLFLAYTLGLLDINKPSYSADNVDAYYWADLHQSFGTWHRPGSRYKHQSPCFDVEYTANSYGARDKARELTSEQPRIIVLGDSFVEGYGLPRQARLSDRLESRTGIAHLNFGVGGDVGPTQYFLIYTSLAQRFSHDGLLVGVLPANDFKDSDYEYGLTHHTGRYRAYFKGEPPDVELVHYNEAAYRWILYAGFTNRAKRWLAEFTYTYNFLVYIKSILLSQHRGSYAGGYFEYDEKQLAIVLHALGELAQAAGDRPMVVFTIPTLSEIKAFDAGQRSSLPDVFRNLADTHGFTYMDLLTGLHASGPPWEPYYLSCDPHWSPAGNKAATDILIKTILYQN